jgi:hypothetical protein
MENFFRGPRAQKRENHMKRSALLFLILVFACLGAGEAQRRKLPAPAHLPETARDLLTERMMNHGNDMSDLMWATLFLDDQSVADIADHISTTPRFARPLTRDATELNSLLPPEFFELQDQLVERATELAENARRKDADAMAASYGALMQTCVRCHSVYMSEPPATDLGSLGEEDSM